MCINVKVWSSPTKNKVFFYITHDICNTIMVCSRSLRINRNKHQSVLHCFCFQLIQYSDSAIIGKWWNYYIYYIIIVNGKRKKWVQSTYIACDQVKWRLIIWMSKVNCCCFAIDNFFGAILRMHLHIHTHACKNN